MLRGGEVVVCNRPQVPLRNWRLKHRQLGCQCHCASLFPLQEVRQGPLLAQNRFTNALQVTWVTAPGLPCRAKWLRTKTPESSASSTTF